MKNMTAPTNLHEGIALLQSEGFQTDLSLDDNCLYCPAAENIDFESAAFKIDRRFEFSNAENSSKTTYLFAISSDHYQLKGYMTSR
ncbi:MAG: hypothetical protein RL757_3102 [Bacteroidota bacterium]